MGPSGSQIGTTGWICRIFLLLGRRMEERNLKTGRDSEGLPVWKDQWTPGQALQGQRF
jgi:hypothetical protein